MFFVYVLYSFSLRKSYVGFTQNLEKRLIHHNLGLDRWSRRGVPWIRIYSEAFETKNKAILKEKWFKRTGAGRRRLNEILTKLVSTQGGI